MDTHNGCALNVYTTLLSKFIWILTVIVVMLNVYTSTSMNQYPGFSPSDLALEAMCVGGDKRGLPACQTEQTCMICCVAGPED